MAGIDKANEGDADLPPGVVLRALTAHDDGRGTFTEVFRSEWRLGAEPVQWNVVRSAPGVLRGVHAHLRHDDYLIVVSGRAVVGLCDLRGSGPDPGESALIELRGDTPACLVIPHGVAHGFLFEEPSLHMYAVTDYWSPADELGCRWDDPSLGIDWPVAPTTISERDANLPPLRVLQDQLRSHSRHQS